MHELVKDTGRGRAAEEGGDIIDVGARGKVVVEGLEGGREGGKEGAREKDRRKRRGVQGKEGGSEGGREGMPTWRKGQLNVLFCGRSIN